MTEDIKDVPVEVDLNTLPGGYYCGLYIALISKITTTTGYYAGLSLPNSKQRKLLRARNH